MGRALAMVAVIAHDRRNPPAAPLVGAVTTLPPPHFLVDRHGVDADEVHDLVGGVKVAPRRLGQAVMDRLGAAHDLEAPRRRARFRQPRSTQANITSMTRPAWASASPWGLSAASLARISSAIERPLRAPSPEARRRAERIGERRLDSGPIAPRRRE